MLPLLPLGLPERRLVHTEHALGEGRVGGVERLHRCERMRESGVRPELVVRRERRPVVLHRLLAAATTSGGVECDECDEPAAAAAGRIPSGAASSSGAADTAASAASFDASHASSASAAAVAASAWGASAASSVAASAERGAGPDEPDCHMLALVPLGLPERQRRTAVDRVAAGRVGPAERLRRQERLRVSADRPKHVVRRDRHPHALRRSATAHGRGGVVLPLLPLGLPERQPADIEHVVGEGRVGHGQRLHRRERMRESGVRPELVVRRERRPVVLHRLLAADTSSTASI